MDLNKLNPKELKSLSEMYELLKEQDAEYQDNNTDYDKLTIKQKVFVAAFKAVKGTSITLAAKQAKVGRDSYYRWREESESFKTIIDSIDPATLLVEEAEFGLLKCVKEGKERSIHFVLETLGKSRGYVKKQEVVNSGGFTLNVTKTYEKKEKFEDE